MKADRWSDASIPRVADLKSIVGLPDARRARGTDRRAWARRAFATLLNERMTRVVVQTGLRLGAQGLEPSLAPRCLTDLLYLTLLHHSGTDDTVPRRCNGCHGLFFVRVTNHRRTHCGTGCKNTAKMRRRRQRHHESGPTTSRTRGESDSPGGVVDR